MSSKWEGVPIGMVPYDERECEKTRREDEAEKKRVEKGETVHKDRNVVHNLANSADSIPCGGHYERDSPQAVVEGSSVDVIANMNAPSIFSRGLHSGMMSKHGAQSVNKTRVPDSPMGTQMVAKQDRDRRPMPIPQSKQDESLRKELDVARKQIELDEQDKEALRETIEKQKKKIAELEKRPILTDEMIADLVTLRKRKEGEKRRNEKYMKRHGYA